MRIFEISKEDKNILILKGIHYNFIEDYNLAVSISEIVGNSNYRRVRGLNTIENSINSIQVFLDQGFSDNDLDIIAAKNIYNNLLEIKNKL